MELIGGIKYLGNRSRGREPNHGKRKPAHDNTRNVAVGETNAPAAANHFSTECDIRPGQKVDTSA
jgi:hypothetical protein